MSDDQIERRSYRIAEVLKITGLSRSVFYRAVKNGKLRVSKLEGTALVLREDLDDFYAALRVA